MKKIIALVTSLLFSIGAHAVCNPFTANTVLTASALNGALSAGCITSGSIDGTAIGSAVPAAGTFTTVTSTIATGTAPFAVSSTTPVANLSIGGNAATATSAVVATTAGNVTGVVAIANGGTNQTTFTAPVSGVNAIPYFDGTRLVTDVVPSDFGYNAASGVATFNNVTASGGLASSVSPEIAAATYTQLAADSDLLVNFAGTVTITLLNPATYPGRYLTIRTYQAQLVNSASANVSVNGVVGSSILAATAGKWARLKSDGVNWEVITNN